MHSGAHSAFRRTLLLLVLCAFVLGQWCAFSAEYQQHGTDEHCCLLCHIGPYASFDSAVRIEIAPPIAAVWIRTADDTTAPRDATVSAASSRGPPSGSLS